MIRDKINLTLVLEVVESFDAMVTMPYGNELSMKSYSAVLRQHDRIASNFICDEDWVRALQGIACRRKRKSRRPPCWLMESVTVSRSMHLIGVCWNWLPVSNMRMSDASIPWLKKDDSNMSAGSDKSRTEAQRWCMYITMLSTFSVFFHEVRDFRPRGWFY
jgi:hypothetical protein